MKRSHSEDLNFENLADPEDVHPSIRTLELFYFQPESVPNALSGILY
jgi:hypothetical protein